MLKQHFISTENDHSAYSQEQNVPVSQPSLELPNNQKEEITVEPKLINVPLESLPRSPVNLMASPKIPLKDEKHLYEKNTPIMQENLAKHDSKIIDKIRESAEVGNKEREYLEQYFNCYVPPDISREALATNRIMLSTTTALNTINDNLNLGIERNKELGESWKKHIGVLDNYIKSLHDVPWKKIFTYSACTITIVGFLFKMGAMRSIPQLTSNIISAIPMPSITSSTEVPKPKLETTLRTVMDSPLTPFTIVATIGTLSIGLLVLKGIAWAVRKSPK